MQDTFTRPGAIGWAGQLYDAGGYRANSKLASENIQFGRRLQYDSVAKETVSMYGLKSIVQVLSTDLITGNVWAQTLKILNLSTGVETTNVLTATYASSHAATLAALVTAIEALTGINAAGTTGVSDTLTIVPESGYIVGVSGSAVTGGASQPTITTANADSRLDAGFAGYRNKEMQQDSSGNWISQYNAGVDMVDNIYQGHIIVDSETGFAAGDTLYVVGYGSGRGKINNVQGNYGIAVSDLTVYLAATGTNSRGVVAINQAG